MKDRVKTNLYIVFLLFVDLAISFGLYYISISMYYYSAPYWVYILIEITPFIFGVALSGLIIGNLSSQADLWKFAIGMMGVASIVNILLILASYELIWVQVFHIIWLFVCNTIIFLVTYFVSQNKLKKIKSANQQDLTDEEFVLLETISG
jgi:hypothetical protein